MVEQINMFTIFVMLNVIGSIILYVSVPASSNPLKGCLGCLNPKVKEDPEVNIDPKVNQDPKVDIDPKGKEVPEVNIGEFYYIVSLLSEILGFLLRPNNQPRPTSPWKHSGLVTYKPNRVLALRSIRWNL
ncbi:uncharacterized protein LOC100571516 isoform X2 [Acyrthosiphon pisum]|uniref:Uncharacterized protein n=1 Tax=Acyrthosiphon pisum TaxID=7029 RepID=A0A8R2JUV1_ACYPI|nr:uncharacterized protein LOC100571516 isoform X2 [Acyrthosiphon pisum]